MKLKDIPDAEFWAEVDRRLNEMVNAADAARELGISTAAMTVKIKSYQIGREVGRGVYLTYPEVELLRSTLGKRRRRKGDVKRPASTP
jgi:hypothetical protein